MPLYCLTEKIFLHGRQIAEPLNGRSQTVRCLLLPGQAESKHKAGLWRLPVAYRMRTPAVVKGDGQGRGNSGIFLMGKYELQVLDNYNNRTYSNGQAGSIYKQTPPKVNVCRPPGEWQTYDIIFMAPKFYPDGRVKSPARSPFYKTVYWCNIIRPSGAEQNTGEFLNIKSMATKNLSSYRTMIIQQVSGISGSENFDRSGDHSSLIQITDYGLRITDSQEK